MRVLKNTVEKKVLGGGGGGGLGVLGWVGGSFSTLAPCTSARLSRKPPPPLACPFFFFFSFPFPPPFSLRTSKQRRETDFRGFWGGLARAQHWWFVNPAFLCAWRTGVFLMSGGWLVPITGDKRSV